MRLYKHNRIAGAYDLDEVEIARRFLASRYDDNWRLGWPLDRALRVFITAPEPAGLASSFDDLPAYEQVFQAVLDLDRARSGRG